ncbi:hypothetical protein [Thermodesulfobacterium hveragerdense]|uniref:hypothetical protein n=1 Tax=Thermodesulfobacterium hveragerdense TaxID=53424 RepID=UPI000418AE02|nr:hypothetical protein [Thermodesulfobacterium hveragerdense]
MEHIEWFESLKEKGYFSAEKAPGSKPADKESYWTIPCWDVLPYLEKVSQQVNEPTNEKYIDELLCIIREVTKYYIEHERILDNFLTWYSFVKILCNIPNDRIPVDIIDLILIWLDSKFDNILSTAEIIEKLLPKFLNSDDPNDWIKAEKIVDAVTQIKWIPIYTEKEKEEIREKHKHIFEKPEEQRTDEEKLLIEILLDEEEPKTIVDTYWLGEVFINKRIASKVGEKFSENIIFNLADKLKSIFKKKQGVEYKLCLLIKYFRGIIKIFNIF